MPGSPWATILGPDWRIISFSTERVQFIRGNTIPSEGMLDMFQLPSECSYVMVELFEAGLLQRCEVTVDCKHVLAHLKSGATIDLMDPITTRAFELRREMERLLPEAGPIAVIQTLLNVADTYREAVNKCRKPPRDKDT